MYQLEERMLSVGAGFAPIDRSGLVIDSVSAKRDVLAVALHGELLQIGGKALEILLVREDGHGRYIKKIAIPDGEQPEQNRQISSRRRVAEMLVHRVKSRQHLAEAFR